MFNIGDKVQIDNKKISGLIERAVWIYVGKNKDELFYTVICDKSKKRYTIHNKHLKSI